MFHPREATLGTLKVSGLYHKKVKFPLKISDRAWWLEVLVLKNPGKSSRRKGNGPEDMEIDHVGMVQSSLSSNPYSRAENVTEVCLEHKKPGDVPLDSEIVRDLRAFHTFHQQRM